MREIVNTQLLRGEPASAENINQAVDRMMHEIPLVNMLQVSDFPAFSLAHSHIIIFAELEPTATRHQH